MARFDDHVFFCVFAMERGCSWEVGSNPLRVFVIESSAIGRYAIPRFLYIYGVVAFLSRRGAISKYKLIVYI